MPISIAIANQQQVLKLSTVRLRQVVRKTLEAEGVADAEVSLALVDDASMHELNRRHLAHDYPTDVLSFELSEPGAPRLEGELIVSTETAVRQSAEFGWTPEDEVTLYLVHGLLHLCGYDDHGARAKREMRARERAILQIWGLLPHYQRS